MPLQAAVVGVVDERDAGLVAETVGADAAVGLRRVPRARRRPVVELRTAHELVRAQTTAKRGKYVTYDKAAAQAFGGLPQTNAALAYQKMHGVRFHRMATF